MSVWQHLEVPFKFQLGDKTLFSRSMPLYVHQINLTDGQEVVALPSVPNEPLPSGCCGFLIRSLPVKTKQPILRRSDGYLCYVPTQYHRHYIDLRQSFSAYEAGFSAKSRSTLRRKVKKYAKFSSSEPAWRVYKRKEEMLEFHAHARTVSQDTYQEKLFDAGLPDNEAFKIQMLEAAGQDAVRAYLLFHQNRPVAYLYCPIVDGVVIYQYLGYDPEYREWSVGTVLQWLALEDLFREGRFKIFDFTEGQGEHKSFFATDSLLCANVFFIRIRLTSIILIFGHWSMNKFSETMGGLLDRLGLKARIRQFIRFGS